jgi:type IV pilus assembly protein PilA
MKTPYKPARGFTLLEIMVVTLIIGMLCVLAIPAFYMARQKSRDSVVSNNLRQIAAAAVQYMMEQGVSIVNETQLMGTSTTSYLHPIQTIVGEDYTGIVINNATSQIEVNEGDGTLISITYNF